MKKGLLLTIILMVGFCVRAEISYAATEVIANITAETTWHESKSPYIVDTPLTITAPLTIEPGVIVKFKHKVVSGSDVSYLDVKSELKAIGTPEKKIIFTSIKDDEAGGDDNNDGTATEPATGDWVGITMNENSYNSRIEYAEILYAHKGIHIYDYRNPNYRELILRNSEIKFCGEGLRTYNSIPTVENNTFEQNGSGIVAYYDPTKERVPKFRNNSIVGNTIAGLDGRYVYGYVADPPIDARYNWWGDTGGPNLTGSGENKILGAAVMSDRWLGGSPQPMPKKPVILIPGIGASINWDLMLGGVLPEKWTLMGHTYDGIIEALKEMGYEEGRNLFICYYDWRASNTTSAENYLKPLINKALTESGAFSVNIVAHSMGGLVARSYIQSDGYKQRNDVENLIMIGTPNKGSSDVYPVWEGGRIPKNWESGGLFRAYLWFLDTKKLTLNNYQSVHQYIPSIKELLPIYNYIHPKNNPNSLKSYNTGMQEVNSWLITLNGGNNALQKLNARVKVVSISGNGQSTINKIPVTNSTESPLWVDGKPDPIDPVRNDTTGDKRVLLSSSQIQSYFSKVLDYDHGDIVDQSETLIADLLEENLSAIHPSPEIRDELAFWFASPVDVEIKDPEGKIIRKDFSDIANGLAQYSGESKPDGFKFVSIPNPVEGDYKIKLTGNGEGEYHVGSIYADYENETPDRESIEEGTISTGETTGYKLEYDTNKTENPVSDIKPADIFAPAITESTPDGELPGDTTETQISLATDEEAACKYSAAASTNYDSMEESFITSDGLSHTKTVTGLEPGKTYHFFARCKDESGNINDNDYEIIFSVSGKSAGPIPSPEPAPSPDPPPSPIPPSPAPSPSPDPSPEPPPVEPTGTSEELTLVQKLDSLKADVKQYLKSGQIRKKKEAQAITKRLSHIRVYLKRYETLSSLKKLEISQKKANHDIEKLIKRINKKTPKVIAEEAGDALVEDLNGLRID